MTLQGSYLQSYQKINQLQAEITKLQAENAKLKTESGTPSQLLGLNEELVEISKNLCSENEKIKAELANSSQKVNVYENEIKVLKDSIAKMAIEIANSKTKHSHPMNYETLAMNDRLQDEIKFLQQENKKLSEKNYELEDLINKFKKSNHYWVMNLGHYMTKYGLAKHNAEIREMLSHIKDDYSRTGAIVGRLKVMLEEQKKFMLPK
jgi:chromosome segregation ATPase